PEQTVPVSVQRDGLSGRWDDAHLVSTLISMRQIVREPRSRVQRLMRIPNQVNQPDQVVRSDCVRKNGSRRQSGAKLLELGSDIYRIGILDWCSVRRESDILEVPILVLKIIRIANILPDLCSLRTITRVGVLRAWPFDVVRPHRRADKCILVRP